MSGVVHVVARAVVDDPHTLAVLALANALRDGGKAKVFAAERGLAVRGIDPLARLPVDDSTLLVYHQSGAAPALVSRLTERAARLAVVHGEPPPDALALRDLRALAAGGAAGLATSDAAAARLADVGFTRVSRVPPVVARDRLAAVAAFEPTVHHLDVAVPGPLIVTVDHLAAADDAVRVVHAYHVLRTYLVRAANLAVAVVGAGDTSEAAVQALNRDVWGLRLTDAWVQRLTNPGERAALTRGAAVFVTTGPASGDVRHALVAMAEGVPVVAPANASAAEELGDGAVVLPPGAGAALVAEAVADLLNDESRRTSFAAAAERAVARFDPALVAPIWREAIAG
jgi:hypothetical protein